MALASILDDAAQLALQNAGIDITGLDGPQRATAQALVSRAIDQEWKPETLAARLNPVIGLGPRYANAVQNFRAGLAASKRLSPAQITSRVDAYTKRLKTARSRTVASYETRKQLLDAQRLQWQQDQANGTLPVDAVKRFHYDWHERGCALCYSQDGGIRSISDPFGPPLHPHCGCWETVHVHDTARGKVPLVKAFDPSEPRDPRGRWTKRIAAPLGWEEGVAKLQERLSESLGDRKLQVEHQRHPWGHRIHVSTPSEIGPLGLKIGGTGKDIAWINWGPDGRIEGIHTNSGFKRKGVASTLFRMAKGLHEADPSIPAPVHSEQQTPEGKAWAITVGKSNRFLAMDGHRVVLTKDVMHWIETLHPRHPKGEGRKSGEFAPKGTVNLGSIPPAVRQAPGTKLLARMDDANKSDSNGEKQKRIVNQMHAGKLGDDKESWDAVLKALTRTPNSYEDDKSSDDPDDLREMWDDSVGPDPEKTGVAVKAHNRKQLIALRKRFDSIDKSFLDGAVTQEGVKTNYYQMNYGSELYDWLHSDDPTKILKDGYQFREMVNQVKSLQGFVNTEGNQGKISATNHFVWGNALNTDDIALSFHDYARLGLQTYAIPLPDVNTPEGKAKVRAFVFTRKVVDAWADSSDSPQSLALMMAVAEFAKTLGFDAADLSGPKKYAADNYKRAEAMFKLQRPALLVLAKSMYEETQRDLKEKGITVVHASRGMAIRQRAPWMKDAVKDGGYGEQEIDANMNPLSSWTTSIQETSQFSDHERFNIVARWDIPAKQVFCTALTGLGCLHEYELLPLGITTPMQIRWVDTEEFRGYSRYSDNDFLRGGTPPTQQEVSPFASGAYQAKKQAYKGHPAAKKAAPKVTAGTKLYVPLHGPVRFFKKTAAGQWYRQNINTSGWYKLPKGWQPKGLEEYAPAKKAVKKAVPAKKAVLLPKPKKPPVYATAPLKLASSAKGLAQQFCELSDLSERMRADGADPSVITALTNKMDEVESYAYNTLAGSDDLSVFEKITNDTIKPLSPAQLKALTQKYLVPPKKAAPAKKVAKKVVKKAVPAKKFETSVGPVEVGTYVVQHGNTKLRLLVQPSGQVYVYSSQGGKFVSQFTVANLLSLHPDWPKKWEKND